MQSFSEVVGTVAAWPWRNFRRVLTDAWLISPAAAVKDIRSEAYDRAKASGLLYELEESSELGEAVEFFRAVRKSARQ